MGVANGKRRNGNSEVLDRLRHMILLGEYEPSGRLVEEHLARVLEVSRTPVRQALTRLEAEGLVEIVPNKGAIVRKLGLQEVWDVYDLRALLEGHAARLAAGRIKKPALSRLRGVAAEMEALEDGRFSGREEETRWLVARNQVFHGGIVEAGRNGRLKGLLDRTVELPLVFKAFYWYTPEERLVSNHHHRQLLRSLEQGDGERAEIVMREHVYEGRDTVIRALEEGRH